MGTVAPLYEMPPPAAPPSRTTVTWANVAKATEATTKSKDFPSVQVGGQMASKALRAMFLPAGSTPQQEADKVSATIRAREAFKKTREEKMAARRGPRPGNQRVMVGADMLTAMYVIGFDACRISDLKTLVRQIMPEHRIYHYRFIHGENVEILVRREDYAEIARILTTECALQIRGQYLPVGMMTKKMANETEQQREERNGRFAYRALARFCREKKTPPAVREFFARYQRERDLEKRFPNVCRVETLGEAGDWDLSRKGRVDRERAAERHAAVADTGHNENCSDTASTTSSTDEEEFAAEEDAMRDERQEALCNESQMPRDGVPAKK